MNAKSIERIILGSESSNKGRSKGNKLNEDNRRRCDNYAQIESLLVCRKCDKVRYDTFRRDQHPNEQDEKLENLHYANYLGIDSIKNALS